MPTRTLLVRADANAEIGIGHVMRCLALAQAWQGLGGSVVFALASGLEELEERLRSEGVVVARVFGKLGGVEDATETVALCRTHKADWLVLDGYHFLQSYRTRVKTSTTRLLLMDDHGEFAPYEGDVVLNANPYASDAMYSQRGEQTRFLLGPRYALLRREFLEFTARTPQARATATASRILITFGGADSQNVTQRLFEALQEIRDTQLDITVVVGASNPHHASLRAAVEKSFHVARLLLNVDYMPAVISEADVAISAGGGTCYEIAFMGVPMFLITIAANHERTVEAWGEAKAAIAAGWFDTLTRESLVAALRGLIGDAKLRGELVDNASCMVDGKGAQRVVEMMTSMRQEDRITA